MHTGSTSRPSYEHLLAENAELRRQLEWLKRQIFGPKSERRHIEGEGATTDLFARDEAPAPEAPAKEKVTYERDKPGAGKARGDAVTDEGLRFDCH